MITILTSHHPYQWDAGFPGKGGKPASITRTILPVDEEPGEEETSSAENTGIPSYPCRSAPICGRPLKLTRCRTLNALTIPCSIAILDPV